jgi:hypothetical protein
MAWTRDELAKRSDDQIADIASRVTNRLAKWRSVFAGWQLGTRADTDAESQAVRDHREVTMLMRAELNALTACCIEAGLFTARAFTEQVIVECEHLDGRYEKKFPGFTATDIGMNMKLPDVAETMKGWRP